METWKRLRKVLNKAKSPKNNYSIEKISKSRKKYFRGKKKKIIKKRNTKDIKKVTIYKSMALKEKFKTKQFLI